MEMWRLWNGSAPKGWESGGQTFKRSPFPRITPVPEVPNHRSRLISKCPTIVNTLKQSFSVPVLRSHPWSPWSKSREHNPDILKHDVLKGKWHQKKPSYSWLIVSKFRICRMRQKIYFLFLLCPCHMDIQKSPLLRLFPALSTSWL